MSNLFNKINKISYYIKIDCQLISFCDYLDLFRIYDVIDIVSRLDAIDRINFILKHILFLFY